jgi:predicted kinase
VTLSAGLPVILDGTFLDTKRRRQAQKLAHASGVPLLFVETVCDEETALRRIAERVGRGNAHSDATTEVYRRQRESLTSLPPTLPADVGAVGIDTTSDVPADLGPALMAITACGALRPKVADGPT